MLLFVNFMANSFFDLSYSVAPVTESLSANLSMSIFLRENLKVSSSRVGKRIHIRSKSHFCTTSAPSHQPWSRIPVIFSETVISLVSFCPLGLTDVTSTSACSHLGNPFLSLPLSYFCSPHFLVSLFQGRTWVMDWKPLLCA